MAITIKEYSSAGKILRQKDLRQALYDAGEVLMEKVLVNLHGNEHKSRRSVESKILQPNFFRWYEKEVFSKTLQETIYPYLKEGKADLVDLAYRILLNLTADFSGVDRPKKTAEETGRLLNLLRTFGKAATLGQAKGDKKEIVKEIEDALDEFDRDFYKPSKKRRLKIIKNIDDGLTAEDDLPKDILTELLKNQDNLKL